MFEQLRRETAATCDGEGCDRPLAEAPTLAYRTADGERRMYDCDCGTVTMTVARGSESTR